MGWGIAIIVAAAAFLGGYAAVLLLEDCRGGKAEQRWPWGMLGAAFIAGATVSSFSLRVIVGDAELWIFNQAAISTFAVWIGAVVRDFTPWAAILVAILLVKPARDKLVQLLEGFTSVLGEMVNRLQTDDTVELWGARFSRAGKKLFVESPAVWTENLAELIRFRNRSFDRQSAEMITQTNLLTAFRRFADDYIFNQLGDHDWRNISAPRIALHLVHPHFEESLYQLTEYLYPNGEHSHGKRGRRFSVRAGIAGRAYRTNQFEYDPQVDLNPEDLIPKWGFTWEEAARYGQGRCTHFAYPVWDPIGQPICIVFFDAPPIRALSCVNGQLEDHIHLGLEQSGLQAVIQQIHNRFVDDPKLIIPGRDR